MRIRLHLQVEFACSGIAQAHRYADTEVVRRNISTTTLHKIVVVYRGMDMVVCEEV